MENTNTLKSDLAEQFKSSHLDANTKDSSIEQTVKSDLENLPSTFDAERNTSYQPVTLVRVVVDDNHLSKATNANTFQFRHEDDENLKDKEKSRSIFEINKHHSFPLEHHTSETTTQNNFNEKQSHSDEPSRNGNVLPRIISKDYHNFSSQEHHPLHEFNSPAQNSSNLKKSKRLYDYSNPAYLEKSRKSRRRKQSEVDIEVGLRLSRYARNPYEGCVDKILDKPKRNKLLHKRHNLNFKTLTPPSSSTDTSPSGSTERLARLNTSTSEEYLSKCSDQEIREYFHNKKEHRRRSLSASPPRSASFRHLQTPVSPVVGPQRYRQTTFVTILHPATEQPNTEPDRTFERDGLLPNINEKNSIDSTRDHSTNYENCFTCSLPSSVLTAKFRQHTHNRKVEERNMTKKMSKNGVQVLSQGRESTSKNASPASHRKHVLLNTGLPCGSPTFQRAMKGLKPEDCVRAEKDESKSKCQIRPSLSKKSGVRISSAGGRRIPYKSSPLTTPDQKSKSQRISFRESADDCCSDYSETMAELRDKISNLDTNEAAPVLPRKSILKNRRRSIDDLDVGTKKGLAMYLKSKQKESRPTNTSRPNVHFIGQTIH